MARLPKVRLKAIPVFPSSVTGGAYISVTKANGVYSIDFDVSDATISGVPAGEVSTTYALTFGGVTDDNPEGTYSLTPFSTFSLSELGTALGLVAHVGETDYEARTITGTANEITLVNGDGVSGNPTVSLPSALTFTGKTITGGTFSVVSMTVPDNTFTLKDNGDATKQLQFQLSGITTATTRTLTVPNASGTIALTSDKLSAFAATTSAELKTVISDETGSGALVFGTSPAISSPTVDGGTFNSAIAMTIANGGFGIYDTDGSHVLAITPGSNLTAGRTLTLTTGDASRTLNLGGDLVIGGAFTISGAFSTTLTVTGATTVTLPTTGTLATLSGTETLSNKTMVAPVLGVASATSLNVTGTGGSGFVNFTSETPPTTPSTGYRQYADLSGRMAWKGTNGFVRAFDGLGNTADHLYILPDEDGTLIIRNGNVASIGTGSLTIGSAKAPTISNTLTFSGTDGSTAAFGAGGTVAYTANKLSAFAATTSAELAGVISDETGSGALVFGTSPSLTTPTLGVASSTSETITGTGGAGFLQIANQASAPSTPTTAIRFFSDSSNRFSWKGTNGFVRTFDGTANTADRVYVLPDLAGTITIQNGNVITVGTATLTVASAKAPTISNTLTLAGTDGTTITFQGTDTYVGRATTDTLTNKSVSLGSNTVTGTIAQFNTALTDGDFATTSGNVVTIGNGSLTIGSAKAPTISNTLTFSGTDGSTITFGAGGTVVYASGNVVTVGNATLTLGSSKAPTISNTITFAGTDGTVMTFPSTSASVARIDAANAGSLTSSSASAGVGYATGAGGTVTQATNKFTAVTLNTACGTITLNNAALAAGATAYFVLNNSVIAATDLVYVSLAAGFATEATYRVDPEVGFAGVCTIRLQNISAGSLSEAVKIRFAVIKAVNA